MTLESNKAIARVWFDEVMNNHDLDALDRAYAPDYVHRGPDGHEVRGRDGARKVAEALIEAVPDRHSTVVGQVAEGDTVVTRWISRGTRTGPLYGRPPTGAQFTAQGIVISRIADGMIAEDWEMVWIDDEGD